MEEGREPYLIIAGPTASGKTALAVKVAKRLNGEVVSADSMQVYDTAHIGTARPTAEEMQGVPHHLLGFLPLHEMYSVARYMDDAAAAFAHVIDRGHTPVMCGGTGLYIQSFMENRQLLPRSGDNQVRDDLMKRAQQEGGLPLLRELERVDPDTAARLHVNDIHRIVRALEVYHTTGKTITQQAADSHSQPSPYTPCMFLLNYRERKTLYERIDQRVERMLEDGLLEEARTVLRQCKDATVLQAIGYKELLPYFTGEVTLDEAVEKLKTQTRHYAKRQLSWFRRMPEAQTIYVDEYTDLASLAEDIVGQFNDFCKE